MNRASPPALHPSPVGARKGQFSQRPESSISSNERRGPHLPSPSLFGQPHVVPDSCSCNTNIGLLKTGDDKHPNAPLTVELPAHSSGPARGSSPSCITVYGETSGSCRENTRRRYAVHTKGLDLSRCSLIKLSGDKIGAKPRLLVC